MRGFSFAIGIFFVLVSAASIGTAQTAAATDKLIKATPAYAEVLLKETEIKAELESLLIDYTDEFPKVKELRHALTLVARDKATFSKLKATDTEKLGLSLGKMIVRRIEAEMDLWRVSQTYADNHPDVRRAKKKVEVFDQAIKEILG